MEPQDVSGVDEIYFKISGKQTRTFSVSEDQEVDLSGIELFSIYGSGNLTLYEEDEFGIFSDKSLGTRTIYCEESSKGRQKAKFTNYGCEYILYYDVYN